MKLSYLCELYDQITPIGCDIILYFTDEETGALEKLEWFTQGHIPIK